MAKKILGVTGCPTGIAHTFMAEEALKKAAAELGCEIKVETNGAIGVENALTAKEAAEDAVRNAQTSETNASVSASAAQTAKEAAEAARNAAEGYNDDAQAAAAAAALFR